MKELNENEVVSYQNYHIYVYFLYFYSLTLESQNPSAKTAWQTMLFNTTCFNFRDFRHKM